MTETVADSLARLESDLWEAADQLRANSKLTSTEYCMPVLGVIFLRHAANRFEAATRQIQADQAAGRIKRGGIFVLHGPEAPAHRRRHRAVRDAESFKRPGVRFQQVNACFDALRRGSRAARDRWR